jgi:Fe-S cluster assembly protein SufD
MTLASPPAAVEKFQSARERAAQFERPEWFAAKQEQAWRIFSELGIPVARRGNELWKYTNLRPLAETDFSYGQTSQVSSEAVQSAAPWNDDWNTIVVVDGQFSAQLSNLKETDGLTVQALTESLESESVAGRFASLAGSEEYAFSTLNTALVGDGAHVRVESGTELENPVQVLFVTSAGVANGVSAPRTLVEAGENSSFTLIETYVNLSSTSQLTIPVIEIFEEAGSSVRHYRVQMENEDSFHIGTTRVHQLDDTDFTSTSFAVGASIARNDAHTLIDAPGASCTLHGLYMTHGEQHQDQEISTTHAKPGGSSDQYYKGILAGNSHAVFSGKVIVERDAQKTEANQKDLNLLLSRGAEIDAKPSLEIYADDITASHGATAGHVDRDSLFYLQSRGVDEESAKAILVRGFAEEMLNEFEPESLNEFIEKVIDEQIPVLLAQSDTIGTA